MGRPPDKDVFLSALRDQGNRAGNTTLQRELGWEETKYWKVHEQLFKEGQIEKGKGYGGSVKLTRQDAWWRRQPPPAIRPAAAAAESRDGLPATIDAIPMAVAEALVEEYTSELQLYPAVKKQLETHWTL